MLTSVKEWGNSQEWLTMLEKVVLLVSTKELHIAGNCPILYVMKIAVAM